eukprot:152521-Amphidinium_carterae.1
MSTNSQRRERLGGQRNDSNSCTQLTSATLPMSAIGSNWRGGFYKMRFMSCNLKVLQDAPRDP